MIAASLFNRLAAERGLSALAVSRGTDPDAEIPPLVRDGLGAEGVDLGALRPTRLGAVDGRDATLFVAFDVEVPETAAGRVPVRHWDGTPSVMAAYRAGRDAIAGRVAELVAELARGSTPLTAGPRG
ncbi:MAG TPA: hypothetical protein VEA99_13315 [Gemmatimonadaceae bacterium]|nr:hypothetical protein [Gemmatimonadaceae bacterium]